ncbi:NAD-dependent protein deacylase [Furfurilactobacillus rossiae]|nr:NAD-dependent protein deacylase [Furfurilactobacillus rossiae]QFR68136.1 NAD-dependent protein deacylase [Furfurilactobacillus rossiae]QLE60735.1 NAD-dependent protein deacetylase of SIR2 [Furfurilactobacillus rossiae]
MTENLQTLFDQAQHITFMTGAGVSTASGIPDYRSKSGLYSAKFKGLPPEYLLSHDCFVQQPEMFYDFVKENLYFPDAKPNVIHEKIAALCQSGRASLITQNIDNLDRTAGNDQVVEFHGNLYRCYCSKDGEQVDWHDYMKSMYHDTDHGIIRPDIVLYGESISESALQRSMAAIEAADLLVIVGTSFKVYPFAGLINYRQPNAKLVVVNNEPIPAGSVTAQYSGDAETFFAGLKG